MNLFLEFCTPVWLDQYVFVSSKKTGMFVYMTVHLSVYLLERLFVSEYLCFLDMRVCDCTVFRSVCTPPRVPELHLREPGLPGVVERVAALRLVQLALGPGNHLMVQNSTDTKQHRASSGTGG